MPVISRFLGIVITMYYRDHAPPHFHVRYGGLKARIALDSLGLMEGRLPPRVLGLVTEWGSLHRDELYENWARATTHERLRAIAPLE